MRRGAGSRWPRPSRHSRRVSGSGVRSEPHLRIVPAMEHRVDPATDRVVQACRAMVDAGGPIAVGDLAAEVGCSARTLTRSFRTVARMSPREYRAGARDQAMRWTLRRTPVGVVVLAASDRGLAAVRIGTDADELLDAIRDEFAQASFTRDDPGLRDAATAIAALARGTEPSGSIPLDLHGTAFQARVWEALRRIPAGETRTYAQVAEEIDRPRSVRAVANACAANPVALVVPCHRVVRSDGGLGGYRWGIEVKAHLLDAERR